MAGKDCLINILSHILISVETLRNTFAFVFMWDCPLCLLEGSTRERNGRAVSLGTNPERAGGRT